MLHVTYKWNPKFFVALAFAASVGYLVNDFRGVAWAVAIMFGLSFVIGLIEAWQNAGKSDAEILLEEYVKKYGRRK